MAFMVYFYFIYLIFIFSLLVYSDYLLRVLRDIFYDEMTSVVTLGDIPCVPNVLCEEPRLEP